MTSNAFLNCLSPELRQSILQRCRHVDLPVGTPLFEEHITPRYVHFLDSGVASIVIRFLEGEASEVGLVGSESFPEKLFFLGTETIGCRCFMQVSGAGYRMSYPDCKALFLQDAAFRQATLQHAQYQWFVLMQLSGCNRFHEAEARLARWLLMMADRSGEELDLTQEFLAAMLGLRRTTVTLVASTLQNAGMIRYSRGHITILNRTLLEDTACECYAVVRDLYERVKTTKRLEP